MILAFAYETQAGAKVASDLVEEKEGKYFHIETGEDVITSYSIHYTKLYE